jgi:hypothetical protein
VTAEQPADLSAAQHRQIQIEDDEIGRLLVDGPEGHVTARHNLDDAVSGPFQRMLDQARDVLFIFDDEHARRTAHAASFRLADHPGACFHSLTCRADYAGQISGQ